MFRQSFIILCCLIASLGVLRAYALHRALGTFAAVLLVLFGTFSFRSSFVDLFQVAFSAPLVLCVIVAALGSFLWFCGPRAPIWRMIGEAPHVQKLGTWLARAGLPAEAAPRVLGWCAFGVVLVVTAIVTHRPFDYAEEAYRQLRRDVIAHAPRLNELTDEALAAVERNPGFNSKPIESDVEKEFLSGLDELLRRARSALADAGRADSTAQQLTEIGTTARNESPPSIKNITSNSFLGALRSALSEAAAASLEAAKTAVVATVERELEEARQKLRAAPKAELDSLRKQLSDAITRNAIAAGKAAADATARQVLSKKRPEIEAQARSEGQERATGELDVVRRALARLSEPPPQTARVVKPETPSPAKPPEEDAMRAAAASQARREVQQQSTIRTTQMVLLNEMELSVRSMGFSFCPNMELDGTPLYLTNPVVTSPALCAAKCRGECDGFTTRPVRDGAPELRCMILKNSRGAHQAPGVMSGRRGSC